MSFDLKVLLILALSALGIRLAGMWLCLVGRIAHKIPRRLLPLSGGSHGPRSWPGASQMALLLSSPLRMVRPAYLSSGGGSMGGGQSHGSIRKAAQKMVSVAAEFQPQTRATGTYPLPQRGQVTFYVLTDAGIFTATASQED